MKALLVAAGLGTRLRPITDSIPKCMVTIQNKPLLERWLTLLFESSGMDSVLINTHYLPEVVQEFIKTSPWRDAITLVHEPNLLGTAGTILHNRAFFKEEAFLFAHADNLTRFSVDAFVEAHQHRQPGIEITMMTFDTDAPETCGIVGLDQDNRVIHFYEKQVGDYGRQANAAVYIVEPSVIDFLQTLNKEIIDFSTEVLPHYMGRIQVFHNADYHRDIGTPSSLEKAELEF